MSNDTQEDKAAGNHNFSLYLLAGLTLSMTIMMLGLSLWFLDLGPSLDTLPPIDEAKSRMLDLNPGFRPESWSEFDGDEGTELTLTSPFVVNLEPLRGISIQNLRLTGTRVRDLSPLSGAERLWSFECTENPLLDSIAPLGSVSDLERLVLSGSSVNDLTAISNLSLDVLDVRNSRVSDLSPIANMQLRVLLCAGTNIDDIKILAGMDSLEVINVKETQVASLEPLATCDSLERIDADEPLLQASQFLLEHPNRDRLLLNNVPVGTFFVD
ncbi:MAG: hypothetical protein AAF802_15740 [Planctomycetota bacterium]